MAVLECGITTLHQILKDSWAQMLFTILIAAISEVLEGGYDK